MKAESPDIVYGRFLEALHIGGYTADRVAAEFKWLLKEKRWKQAGRGFEDIDEFLADIKLAQYRINVADRKDIAKMLATERATPRATAKALGVGRTTIQRDLGPNGPKGNGKAKKNIKEKSENGPHGPWFQASPDEVTHSIQVQQKRAEKEGEREQRREENRLKVENTPDLLSLNAVFATIVIDPPWDFEDEGDVDQLARGRPTYVQLPIDQVMAKPIPKLADIDCHLYIWITNRSLPKGFGLIERWGFRYVTCLTWCKPSIGMGNYFRGSSEQILFAIKGSQGLKRKDVGTWFSAPRGDEHSSKPDEFYALVESCSPGPYLDIFGRRLRDGWTVWGADA